MAVPVTELEIKNKELEVVNMRYKEYNNKIIKWTEQVRELEAKIRD